MSKKDGDDSCQEKPNCLPICPPGCVQNCCIKKCAEYTSEEIACKYGNAVVQVHSQFILLGGYEGEGTNEGITGATAGTPLEANIRTDVTVEGNGYFIKGHYIVTTSQIILMPGSLTSSVNRYPFIDENDLTLGIIKNQMIRASRILVSVFNVNGNGFSFVYEAELVGVDGAGNIAVLKINHSKEWNLGNPCIEKCHPYFKFGKSRGSVKGEKVYLIGDYVSNAINIRGFNAVGAITEGLLSDHRYVDYTGWGLAESVLVSANCYAFSSGLPILNAQGRVIGMQTTDVVGALPTSYEPIAEGDDFVLTQSGQGSGLVGGPSENFMRKVILTLIKGQCNTNPNPHLELICDPVGSYYRYRKAYAGIAYDLLTGPMYGFSTDFTSGAPAAGFPRINLDSTGLLTSTPSAKHLIGIRVLGLAGANPGDDTGVPNGYYYVPGGPGTDFLPALLPNSPFIGKVNPGDIITHIGNASLGDLEGQIAPAEITWSIPPGTNVEFTYRQGGNLVNVPNAITNDNYDNLFANTVKLIDFPLLLDYPWYAVNTFPIITRQPYPGFIFPPDQILQPQFPSRSQNLGEGSFHPAF